VLILASRSPQRRAILERLGVPFTVVAPDVEELTEGDAEALATQNARRKARAVAAAHPREVVLGADTVVSLRDRVFGKPRGEQDARAMLQKLGGTTHTVLGGFCLLIESEERAGAATTQVSFRELDEGLLDWYLATGEWRERAGAYAIQGAGAALVREVRGDYENVVGLPLAALLATYPQLIGA
jgi:septum formation protein